MEEAAEAALERGRAEQSSTVDMKKQNCPESKLAEGQKMF